MGWRVGRLARQNICEQLRPRILRGPGRNGDRPWVADKLSSDSPRDVPTIPSSFEKNHLCPFQTLWHALFLPRDKVMKATRRLSVYF